MRPRSTFTGRALPAALLTAALFSCVKESSSSEGGSLNDAREQVITLTLEDAARTRSFLGDDVSLDSFESACHDVTLFQYIVSGTGARLESATYQRLSGRLSIDTQGLRGVKYRFYALLNCGDLTGAVQRGSADSALASLAVNWEAGARSLDGGIPAAAGPVEVTAGVTDRAGLPFTRLASRWDLRLETSLPHGGTFTPTSLRIRQSPRVTAPFRGVNAFREGDEASLEDGDCASQDDLLRLSQGDSVRFYTLENACGELIDNPAEDPWLKVPSQGASVAGFLPTYIEMTGTYRDASGALEVDQTLRMFLGRDTSRDFTVTRGEQRRLLVRVTEGPAADGYAPASSWKIETETRDRRSLSFLDSPLRVDSEQGARVRLSTDRYDLSYQLSGESLFLERVSFDPYAMTVSALPGQECEGTLTARYADGRQAGTLRVILSSFSPSGTMKEAPLALDASNMYVSPESHEIHDPDCPATHSRAHRSDCTVNHTDPDRPDYIPIKDCPNYHSTSDDCRFRTASEPDYSKGSADVSIAVNGGWEIVNGELRPSALVPLEDWFLTDAYLSSPDGSVRHSARLTTRVNGERLVVALSDMDNGPGAYWWHFLIRTKEGLSRHFVFGGMQSGDDYGKTLLYPSDSPCEASLANAAGTVTATCSVAGRRIWAVYDREYLSVENGDGASGSSFIAGDRVKITVNRTGGGKKKIFLLDRHGNLTGENTVDTGKK